MIAITPYIKSELLGDYQDKLLELHTADATLNKTIPPSIRRPTEWLLRQVNCFYSNRIEGNLTHPKEFLKSQESEQTSVSDDMLELLSHLEVQINMANLGVMASDVRSQKFIKSIHSSFYKRLSPHMMRIKGENGNDALGDDGEPVLITPGEYRNIPVSVGSHVPPGASEINGYMDWFESSYNLERLYGTDRVVATAGMHHRLAWIHPFVDGNGRAIRLLTDCFMRCSGFGGYGLWSITRGFARDTKSYYEALKQADTPRQGQTDGRGILSDAGLLYFTKYFIDTALDQVKFFAGLFEPTELRSRIDIYFEMRAKGALPDSDGKPLPILPLMARDIYLMLLDEGPMPKKAIYSYLGKGEQTVSPVLRKMADEKLIRLKPRLNVELMLSSHAIEILFPQLW